MQNVQKIHSLSNSADVEHHAGVFLSYFHLLVKSKSTMAGHGSHALRSARPLAELEVCRLRHTEAAFNRLYSRGKLQGKSRSVALPRIKPTAIAHFCT